MSLAHPRVLRAFGTTNARLREYFTATGETSPDATEEVKVRAKHDAAAASKFRDWVRQIIQDGRFRAFKEYQYYTSADLARDGPPIAPEMIPLRAYAQGRINLVDAVREIDARVENGTLSPECAARFMDTKEVAINPGEVVGQPGVETRKEKTVNILRLEEVCISICRAYLDRRVDAQCNLYNNLKPFAKYDPRDTSAVGRCRAEALSEYADIMAESFGYTHKQRQGIRGMLMYSRMLMFPQTAWECETRPVEAKSDYAGDDMQVLDYTDAAGKPQKMRLKTEIVKEGVPLMLVHPARTLYDRSEPLATINTDTGCRFVGFWDIKRFGEMRGNPAYFNTDRIPISATGGSIYQQNQSFFALLFPGQPINFPNAGASGGATGGPNGPVGAPPQLSGGVTYDAATGQAANVVDLAATNEMKANQGLYTSAQTEMAIYVTDLRVRVVPRDHGMGDYARPVWLRLLVASDNTVIYAEWLPSLPAVYWGHNEDDAKMLNLSQMHEIMWAQDALTNIMSNLLLTMKRMLAQIIVVNKDVIPPEIYAEFKAALLSEKYYQQPVVLAHSARLLKDLQDGGHGQMRDAIVAIVSPVPADANYINNAFKAIAMVLSLLERLMALSPQEQGQPANHEITAEEVAAINKTTEGKFSAISESVDEARAAWKQLIYESALAYGSNTVTLSVPTTFPDDVLKEAGFEAQPNGGALAKPGMTLIGTKDCLVQEYAFSTRDGANRQTDAQSANLLIQIMGTLLPLVGPGTLGKKRIFDMVNTILREIGVGSEFKLQMADGETNDASTPEEADEQKQQAQQQAQTAKDAADIKQAIAQLQVGLKAAMGQGLQSQKAILGLTQAIEKAAGIKAQVPVEAAAAPPAGAAIMPGQTAPGVPAAPGAQPEAQVEDPFNGPPPGAPP